MTGRFLVKAGSVNQVRRAMKRAPGGVRVLGRHDRETIECSHTMFRSTLQKLWPVIQARLENAGLAVVGEPTS